MGDSDTEEVCIGSGTGLVETTTQRVPVSLTTVSVDTSASNECLLTVASPSCCYTKTVARLSYPSHSGSVDGALQMDLDDPSAAGRLFNDFSVFLGRSCLSAQAEDVLWVSNISHLMNDTDTHDIIKINIYITFKYISIT